jgi:ankyrin repeat protein
VPTRFELHREARRGNTARVRELLSSGAEINAVDSSGHTPLMYALESPAASVELVEVLLDGGAEVATNLAACCLGGGDPLKFKLVLNRGANVHYAPAGSGAVLGAAYSRDAARNPRLLELLEMLIARGVALNGITEYGESAVRVFSYLGRFDGVLLLLDSGADEAQLAWTSLHRAVALGTLADVQRLVSDGANLEARDWWERTPWLVAVKTGDIEKARYLVAAGSDTSVMGRGGVSPLDLAIESFHNSMLEWLIELGISVESTPDCGMTPLMNAVEAGNVEAVDILIAAGADVNRKTPCGSALGEVRNREIALRLLDAGADPKDLSFEGRRGILGLEPEPSELLFDATSDDFRAAPKIPLG